VRAKYFSQNFSNPHLKNSCVRPWVVLNLSWFVAPFQRLLTLVPPCSSIKIPNFVLGFAISRQSYLVKASARVPRRTAPWLPQGPTATVEKPWYKSFRKGWLSEPRRTKSEPRRKCIWWGMRAWKFKIWINKWSCHIAKCHESD